MCKTKNDVKREIFVRQRVRVLHPDTLHWWSLARGKCGMQKIERGLYSLSVLVFAFVPA